MSKTIQETIRELHQALKDYIEATYHISAKTLIEQRQELLSLPGAISQVPYLESTPRYETGARFGQMVGIDEAALQLYQTLSQTSEGCNRLLYDPPYKHQSDAVRHSLIERKNLVIMTGTGSGKTESFLMPILGKFAREAAASPITFSSTPAVRALVLYPMNALVNDQLGRMRALFGDPRLVKLFQRWGGRPPRFARYTSRTPYAGMRTAQKDSTKLKSFDEFYVDILRQTHSDEDVEKAEAMRLLAALKERGKWPAKPDLAGWFGEKGDRWIDKKSGKFLRAVTLPDDSELLTRHEVHDAPPDLLVTNYSMLEYMLMRPIERPIFDKTRAWLEANPNEKFLVVLDEAHLYRGAAGAEVGLLLRRLRDRIGANLDRFQVICATASFTDRTYAPKFGAQLSGVPADTFIPIVGTLDLRSHSAVGQSRDAEVLAGISLDAFYAAESDAERMASVEALLRYRHVETGSDVEASLYQALSDFGPMGLLINDTMKQAVPISELGSRIFPAVESDLANAAVTALMALGSIARPDPKAPGLLPCRIHNFFRGLPGLWVCMDPDCSEVSADQRSDICGKMFSQPERQCGCGSRVLELYTCRNCGTAYARAYTDDLDVPSALWSEPGQRLRMAGGEKTPLLPLDLLLETPSNDELAEPYIYDLETGRLNPKGQTPRKRTVYLPTSRLSDAADDEDNSPKDALDRGKFIPCGVCEQRAGFNRSYVQDHQTKGDQPFLALVARQIQIQPPGPAKPTSFAPLQGRKVLAFSDSRQVAARLAPNLQMYSIRDSLRPIIVSGFRALQSATSIQNRLSLDDLFLAVVLASKTLNVRLRPELKTGETFDADRKMEEAIASGQTKTDVGLLNLCMDFRSERPPEALLDNIVTTIQDRFWGFEALALASLVESGKHVAAIEKLPPISGIAETIADKLALVRAWLRCWKKKGFWLNAMPLGWQTQRSTQGTLIKSQKGKFKGMDVVLSDKGHRKIFWEKWSPELLKVFGLPAGGDHYRLKGSEISLLFDGPWVRCTNCKSIHRPVPKVPRCLDCGNASIEALDPDKDVVFMARKGYYRKPVMEALAEPPRTPMALIAAEHTAQLNAPQNDDVFSKAEENELLFQDIALRDKRLTAIDILSSTTTMEVGIDLGALSGVALRNMPPGRANYQQRAGRAGRRGNAVATVVGFGSSDSHDEHYFSSPDGMIRGDVVDPKLTLDNPDIVRRHIRAFLMQNYHQARLPVIDPDMRHDLFSVLGNVWEFRNGTGLLNRADFEAWLTANEQALRARLEDWIPGELTKTDRNMLLQTMKSDCLAALDDAIRPGPGETEDEGGEQEAEEDESEEGETSEEDDGRSRQWGTPTKLLDRLLYCGKLPRYAFPTDVATFHVFDADRSSKYRPIFSFAPSQGLPIALSQYAPGKQVWISGKCYTSGALYSPMSDGRFEAWQSKRIYKECSECGFARTFDIAEAARGDVNDCPACGGQDSFGPGRYWLRPPGFAHPVDADEVTSPDDVPETSYATRAKLTMGTPNDDGGWLAINEALRGLPSREHLLVSNTGPEKDGYNYCTKCGRIEASSDPSGLLIGPHAKPYPAVDNDRVCDAGGISTHLVLGTDFITDIALFSMRVAAPLKLNPTHHSTAVALRTVSEALAKAACRLLEIEPGELLAEYRPALTPGGLSGLEAEIFIYDTLPGGAGFASQLPATGLDIFREALRLVKTCPQNCDASCYRCLRSFKNKFDHSLLDRHVGAQLLEYLLNGEQPTFDPERLRTSTELLCNDLKRQSDGSFTYELGGRITYDGTTITAPIVARSATGKVSVVALSGPLTSDHPADTSIQELQESGADIPIIVENELLVRANLPAATRNVQSRLR